jgi:hypothetical protein
MANEGVERAEPVEPRRRLAMPSAIRAPRHTHTRTTEITTTDLSPDNVDAPVLPGGVADPYLFARASSS